MSGKATGKAWDFRLGTGPRKLVLLAFADHADHEGKNMYPGIALIVWKTELSESTVHRCIKELVEMGLLVPDGIGPKGANRYSLGCQTDTLSERQGVKLPIEGGVKIEPQFPDLRDSVTPELNGRTNKDNPIYQEFLRAAQNLWPLGSPSDFRRKIPELETAQFSRTDHTITVSGCGQSAAMYQDRYAKSFENQFIGQFNEKITVRFEE